MQFSAQVGMADGLAAWICLARCESRQNDNRDHRLHPE
jgi:hypothetical protein